MLLLYNEGEIGQITGGELGWGRDGSQASGRFKDNTEYCLMESAKSILAIVCTKLAVF